MYGKFFEHVCKVPSFPTWLAVAGQNRKLQKHMSEVSQSKDTTPEKNEKRTAAPCCTCIQCIHCMPSHCTPTLPFRSGRFEA